MNILSNEQMIGKEERLLSLYNEGQIKFKLNLQQLIQAKTSNKNIYSFKKASHYIKTWIQKLVPLNKKVYSISIQQQQNALFKVITHVFLFIIYKKPAQPNQYVKDQLRCSLYSDDVDLLEIRNHSFNKKMKSQTIKSVIAYFFQYIQVILQNQQVKIHKIKPEDILAFALQKNDFVAEGFHLFYRNILSKLQVQNANNCIEQVNPQQAISNLIQYFQIQCRVFNQLFLFNDVGVFIAQIENIQSMVFGRYYENQMQYRETSEQQDSQVKTNKKNKSSENQQEVKISPRSFLKPMEIQKEDVKIFNFILQTDRSQLQTSGFKYMEKSIEASTPSFIGGVGQQLRFGKRKSITDQKDLLDSSFNKIKDRLQSQRINQIQSEQQDVQTKNDAPTPFLGGPNSFSFQPVHNNKIFNFQIQDNEQDFQQNDDSIQTPMLGGTGSTGGFFNFGTKQNEYIKQNKHGLQPIQSTQNLHQDEQNWNKKQNGKQKKQSKARRQSYQQDSSKSKSSQTKKLQMKTSKNQIKVIDQTASRISLVNSNELPKKQSDQFVQQRKQTLGYFERISSYSNCTCHMQKKHRIKLNSQIIELKVDTKPTQISKNRSQTKIESLFQNVPYAAVTGEQVQKRFLKLNNLQNNISQNKKHIFKTQFLQTNFDRKFQKEIGSKTPTKQAKYPHKNQQFLNFLKKDKTQLLKKINQKKHSKVNVTNAQIHNFKHMNNGSNKNSQGNRTFVKQSMFVGSYMNCNPQNKNQMDQKNRPTTPSHSINKRYGTKGQGRERSITPNNYQPHMTRPINGSNNINSRTNPISHKDSIQIKNMNNYLSQPPLLNPTPKVTPGYNNSFQGTNNGIYQQKNNPMIKIPFQTLNQAPIKYVNGQINSPKNQQQSIQFRSAGHIQPRLHEFYLKK